MLGQIYAGKLKSWGFFVRLVMHFSWSKVTLGSADTRPENKMNLFA